MNIQAILQGLATAAATVAGIQAHPTVPDIINPPTFCIEEYEIDFNQTFAQSSRLMNVKALLLCQRNEVGRMDLNGFIPLIKTALETDKTLGGVAQTLNVDRARTTFRETSWSGENTVYAEFDLRVWAV